MAAEELKALAGHFANELFNKGNLAIVDELIAPDAVDHNEPAGTDCREHFKRVAQMLRGAFPDLNMRPEMVIAEGDIVAAHVVMTGTHTGSGDFFGAAPSGKAFRVKQMRFLRFANGQVTDSWAVIDMLSWMQQLGKIPAVARPEASGEAIIRGQ
jgi:steroid delta-isomerase-like uncharacterized protein